MSEVGSGAECRERHVVPALMVVLRKRFGVASVVLVGEDHARPSAVFGLVQLAAVLDNRCPLGLAESIRRKALHFPLQN